ncbi:MAG TPA: hypothetical protein VEZ11_14725, partial [Thermoanaerobaculia bacterium]|nr:hypothetical protein [Thermoanaerobaculia bacterium]
MELLSARTRATQPEGRFLQMAENLLSRRAEAIGFSDHLFDLLRDQSAYGDSVFCSDDLRAPNRGLVELNREISSGHPRILRGARTPRQSGRRAEWSVAGHCGRFSNRPARCGS